MRIERRLGIRSAYGQLVFIVFFPIAILAMVGGLLVFFETTRAIKSEQDVLAQAALIRYETMVRTLTPNLKSKDDEPRNGDDPLRAKLNEISINEMTEVLSPHQRNRLGRQINELLYTIQPEQHVKRIGIFDPQGIVMAVVGYDKDKPWGKFDVNANGVWRLPTPVGTAYGMPMYITIDGTQKRYWLFVDMDNEPLTIAFYRIVLALAITGLTTMLLLLLILNLYSKRWITPVYEMRLFLQRLTSDNLAKPLTTKTDGEFYLLQKELNHALRRLNSSFGDLKAHSDETEADLRLAFDEMEMQNISIRKARDMAVKASSTKSAFLANISHELRTPLNAIDGFINLLAKNPNLDSKQTLYVQTIKKSSAHLLALINDVLDFSKIEAGKLTLDKHSYSLMDSVYEVADMLSPTAFEKGLRMSVLFYHDVPELLIGDKLRIKQILTNLIGNALKFTDSGGVDIKISLQESTQDDQHTHDSVLIAISDTGRGVDKDAQSTLFQSFEQGDLSITRRYGGTGLGLVICKELTELMGGRIGFLDNREANIDTNGATFWFSLPITGDDVSTEISLPALNFVSWTNHPKNRTVLSAALGGTGAKLTETKSLAHLLELLSEKNNYDWVLVDSFGQQGDITALLKQVRLHYHGNLIVLGYEVGLDGSLLEHYGAHALYEPIDRRKLYALLDNNKSPSLAPTAHSWQGVRILAVDDHAPNLLVLDALLGELGIEVVHANSGFEAIDIMTRYYESTSDEMSQKHRIDLIFMDISMPIMSGLTATSTIRKLESEHKKPQTPIIALSAHGLWDDKAGLYKAGMNDYATKPIAHYELVQLLQKWLITDSEPITLSTPLPAPKNTDAVIDWQDALMRASNKASLAKQLLTMLQNSILDEKVALRRAWSDKDAQKLSDVTHRLVGATRYTGTPQLRTACEAFYTKLLPIAEQANSNELSTLKSDYIALMEALDVLENTDLGKIGTEQ